MSFLEILEIGHGLVKSLFDACGLGAAVRLVDLEVYAGIVLHADDTEQSADSLGSVALAADDLAHILRVDGELHENAHFIYRAFDLYITWVVDESFDYVFEKCCILFHFVYLLKFW